MPIIPPIDVTEGPRTIYVPPGRVDPPVIIDPDIEVPLSETPSNNVFLSIDGGLVHLTGNPIRISIYADLILPNHRLVLKVSCPQLMGSPFVEKIAPDWEKKAEFEISGLIDQPVEYAFDYPSMRLVTQYANYVFVVTLEIGEEYTDANGDRHITWVDISAQNDVLRVLKGALRPYEKAYLFDHYKGFASEYIDGGKFLTRQPDRQVVSPNQQMKLWFLGKWSARKPVKMNLLVMSEYTPPNQPWGSPAYYSQDTELEPTGLYEFSVMPSLFDFPAGYKVFEYMFWLSDDAGDVSERRTFVVDNEYYEKQYFFYYVNTLGGVDCIRLTGKSVIGLKTESETAVKPIPAQSGTKVSGVKTISINDKRTWTINTGVKGESEMLAMQDFLSSSEIWMVNQDHASALIPVVIDAGDFVLVDSDNDIHSLDVKITEAY